MVDHLISLNFIMFLIINPDSYPDLMVLAETMNNLHALRVLSFPKRIELVKVIVAV